MTGEQHDGQVSNGSTPLNDSVDEGTSASPIHQDPRSAHTGTGPDNRNNPAVTRQWMSDGQKLLGRLVDGCTDDDLRAPSRLDGWSRAHLVGHLARNAEALTRLVDWALTGTETPMYPSREARNADIEASAEYPAEQLRKEFIATAEELDRGLDRLAEQDWPGEVKSALGRPMSSTEIPWMRVREVWVHALDLDAGTPDNAIPADVVDALMTDATGMLSARDGCPSAALTPDDRQRTWTLGEEGGPILRGEARDLLNWLLGRSDGEGIKAEGGDLPDAPRWL